MEFEKLQKFFTGKKFKFIEKKVVITELHPTIWVDIEFEIVSMKQNFFKIYHKKIPTGVIETTIKLIDSGYWKFLNWEVKEKRGLNEFTYSIYRDIIYFLLNKYQPYINAWFTIVKIDNHIYQ